MATTRLPADPATVSAHFAYTALVYDMASILNALAIRGGVIRHAPTSEESQRLADLATETLDTGARLFADDIVATYGNPTTVWLDD